MEMTVKPYPLRFSIASRTLFAFPLSVIHMDAFSCQDSDINSALPTNWQKIANGVILHGVPAKAPRATLERLDEVLCYKLSTYTHYRTDLSGSFDDFLARKSAKTRATLRRKVRKVADACGGNIEWREYRSPEAIVEFFALAGPLADQTYQARLFDGALPRDASFKEQAIDLALKGRLRCFLLFIDSQPAAYLYAPVENHTAIYAYLGYDERHADLSPGTVLQYLVHERLFSDPEVHWFDFTEGEGAHKALFSNDLKLRCNLLFMQNNWMNRRLLGAHAAWNNLVNRAKIALKKH